MTLTDLIECDPDLLIMEGHDTAIVGLCSVDGVERVVYDAGLVMRGLVSQGMSLQDARDYFEFNIACARIGPRTPLLLHRLEREEAEDT